jgi:hypothetical protein
MDDIIIFMNPQQWGKFLEAEKSRAEALELLKKCWNAGDTRGA